MAAVADAGILAAALALAMAAIEIAKRGIDALVKRGNGHQPSGQTGHLAELAASQERLAQSQTALTHLQERLLERIDREIIPRVEEIATEVRRRRGSI